jgi:dipeptidyl aminopeptidase/acylaminoacyl peptidase
MINLERLLRVPRVEAEIGFGLAPGGAIVAFSWNLTGRWELYTCPITGSTAPQPVLPGPGSRFNPQFSPVNPKILACVADFDGGESYHLLLLNLVNGETVDLTPGDVLQPSFAWSPDGKQIAFISNRSGCFSVYCLDLENHREDLVCTRGQPACEVTWSPDGRWLAVTAETGGSDFGISLLEFKVSRSGTFENREIFDSLLNAKDPAWSPDSQKLAFSATLDEFAQIGVFDLVSRQLDWLTAGAGDKTSPAWDPKGKRLVYLHSSGVSNRLAVCASRRRIGGKPVNWDDSGAGSTSVKPGASHYSIAPGIHQRPRFTSDEQSLLFLFENPQNPPDLWQLSLVTGAFTQLTRSLPAGIDQNDLPLPVEILYPALEDGLQVPALLHRPENLPAPAVVNLHGGPNWHYSLDWNPFMSHLASRGWVVLAPNYRGSTGYGRAWQAASRYDLGGCDARDVAAGAEYLLSAGLAEPGRIVITGRSHGGYLAMTCLTQYPDLWVAGSGEVPFFDWFSSHAASRTDLQHWNIENMGNPLENEALWHERSPYFYLDRVAAPVQIICGGLDPRCPAVDSIAAHDKLLSLGKTVDFLLYPDEGHVFLKMENILEAENRRVEFLARYLQS